MVYIQAVLIPRSYKESHQKVLQDLKVTPIKRVHETDNYYWYRIVEPNKYDKYRYKRIGRKGVRIILGF